MTDKNHRDVCVARLRARSWEPLNLEAASIIESLADEVEFVHNLAMKLADALCGVNANEVSDE